MKRRILICMAVMLLWLLMCGNLWAESSGSCGDNITWTLDDNDNLTLTGSGQMYNYTSSPWYKNNVKTVKFVGNITGIGNSAFCNCRSLTSIEIPNSVTSIGKDAFNGCRSLTSVTIGNSVTSIGEYAFAGCSCLTSIEIPNSVTSIGDSAFYGCSSLKKVYITDLSAWCRITFNSLSANPLSNGSALYLNGKEVKDLVIPDDVTKIGKRTFSGCSSLSSVTIPNSVTSIGEYAFNGCRSLTSVTIGNSVMSIGSYAFYNCSSLSSVSIPNSVTSIGESAFEYCSRLKKVYITDLSAWCRITFNYFSANPLSNGGALYLNGKEVKDLVIPDDVTKIGNCAFYNCSSLSSVSIPNSVTSIGESAFNGCRSLKKVYITDLSAWCRITFNDSSANPLSNGGALYLNGKEVKDLFIPDDVTKIGNSAFHNCSSLSSVSIPNSVTSIDEFAFYGCSSLTSIEIPNSVTSIGDATFYGCSSLTSIEIPNSVTSIGDAAFYGCSSLTSIEIPNSVTSIGDAAFCYCNSLKIITVNATTPPDCGDYIFEGVDYSSCVLVVPDESISAYKNKSPWNQFLNISEVERVINDNDVSVKVENGNIVVTGTADDVNMEVYNISGSRIYSGIVKSVQAPTAGLYLVKVLDKSYKIMVR